MTDLHISNARDLKPGQHIVLDYGALHGRDLAVVVGHVHGAFGHHAECIIVSRNADGEQKNQRSTVTGTPSEGTRIGWRPAFRYTVRVRCLRDGKPFDGFWTQVDETAGAAHYEARRAFEEAGHVVTSTELATTDF